jgi:hypothetical protein
MKDRQIYLKKPSDEELKKICAERNISFEQLTDPSKITLDSPLNQHATLTYDCIFKVPYPSRHQRGELPRPVHGVLHATRAAIYLSAFVNLRRRYNDPEALALKDEDVKLLQIAMLFHDSARLHDGKDEWDKESAYLLYAYLVKTLGVPEDKALAIAEAVAHKDQKNEKQSSQEEKIESVLNIDSDEEDDDKEIKPTSKKKAIEDKEDFSSNKQSPKNIYQKLIHDADCLDITRARYSFDANYLDFYHDIAKHNKYALNDMAKLIMESRSLIEIQGDACDTYRQKKQVKRTYEAPDVYNKIIRDIQFQNGNKTVFRYQDAKKTQASYPLLSAFGLGLVSDPKKYDFFDIKDKKEQKSAERKSPTIPELTTLLYKGQVFARSITQSYGFRTKLRESKDGKGYIEEKENLIALELYKAARREGIPTRTTNPKKIKDRLKKQGNPYRSTSMLGWGSIPFHNVGFLTLNLPYEQIHRVSENDIASGIHKKKVREHKILSSEEKERNLFDLQKKQKMGGSFRNFNMGNDPSIALHNEVLADLTEYDAIYFSDDPSYCLREMTGQFYSPHPYIPMLEAIFMNYEYERKHGKKLPIYYYSGIHNQCIPFEYNESDIIEMWKELIEFSLTELIQSKNYVEFKACQDIDYMGIMCIRNRNNIREELFKLGSPIENYPPQLKDKITKLMKEEWNKQKIQLEKKVITGIHEIENIYEMNDSLFFGLKCFSNTFMKDHPKETISLKGLVNRYRWGSSTESESKEIDNATTFEMCFNKDKFLSNPKNMKSFYIDRKIKVFDLAKNLEMKEKVLEIKDFVANEIKNDIEQFKRLHEKTIDIEYSHINYKKAYEQSLWQRFLKIISKAHTFDLHEALKNDIKDCFSSMLEFRYAHISNNLFEKDFDYNFEKADSIKKSIYNYALLLNNGTKFKIIDSDAPYIKHADTILKKYEHFLISKKHLDFYHLVEYLHLAASLVDYKKEAFSISKSMLLHYLRLVEKNEQTSLDLTRRNHQTNYFFSAIRKLGLLNDPDIFNSLLCDLIRTNDLYDSFRNSSYILDNIKSCLSSSRFSPAHIEQIHESFQVVFEEKCLQLGQLDSHEKYSVFKNLFEQLAHTLPDDESFINTLFTQLIRFALKQNMENKIQFLLNSLNSSEFTPQQQAIIDKELAKEQEQKAIVISEPLQAASEVAEVSRTLSDAPQTLFAQRIAIDSENIKNGVVKQMQPFAAL